MLCCSMCEQLDHMVSCLEQPQVTAEVRQCHDRCWDMEGLAAAVLSKWVQGTWASSTPPPPSWLDFYPCTLSYVI